MGIRSWLNRWAERVMIRERDRLAAELDQLRAEIDAKGIKLTMTDAQYAKLKASAEKVGPDAVARVEEMARKAGRVETIPPQVELRFTGHPGRAGTLSDGDRAKVREMVVGAPNERLPIIRRWDQAPKDVWYFVIWSGEGPIGLAGWTGQVDVAVVYWIHPDSQGKFLGRPVADLLAKAMHEQNVKRVGATIDPVSDPRRSDRSETDIGVASRKVLHRLQNRLDELRRSSK